jgi:hypothetical protein
MSEDEKTARYHERVELLEEFRKAILNYFSGDYGDKGKEQLKSFINRNVVAARSAVRDAGTLHYMTLAPPPAIGGPIARGIDPFDMIFQGWYGSSLIPNISDMVEQAIGVYHHLEKQTGSVRLDSVQAIHIEAAIERALRPAFDDSPPSSEREVQNRIEIILNAIGIEHIREKEAATIGARAFHPDFTVPSLSLAIEVKLATKTHGASAIQEELAADISAYSTKWKRLLFIIYDTGVITDPYQMQRANKTHFGASIIIVKH